MTVTIGGGFAGDDVTAGSVTMETLPSNACKDSLVDDDGKRVILFVGIAVVIDGAHGELYVL